MDDLDEDRSSSPKPLDDVDRRLLELLQADGRLSVRELAARARVSRAGAYTRLQRLRADGALRGFSAQVDPRALGRGLAAFVSVKLTQQSWKDFRDAVLALPEVDHVFLVSGDSDCLLLVRTADADGLRDLVLDRLQALPAVLATQTVLVFDEASPGDARLADSALV